MAELDVFWHPAALDHDTGSGLWEAPPSDLLEVHELHPENAERIRNMRSVLLQGPLASRLDWKDGRLAEEGELETVHDPAYIASLRRDCESGGRRFGSTTVLSSTSWPALLAAAGTTLAATDALVAEEVSVGYALVRPPGHHAGPAVTDGYCFFNNAALAAERFRASGADRVAIVDWDVHHGNGTQHIFEEDPTVFYFSCHQMPLYPGTGYARERGRGVGEGATLNVPLSPGDGDDRFLAALTRAAEAMDDFRPEFVLVSAGFDGHQDDLLGGLSVTTRGFAEATRIVRGIADDHAGGRIVSMLEGGYELNALAASAAIHVETLLSD